MLYTWKPDQVVAKMWVKNVVMRCGIDSFKSTVIVIPITQHPDLESHDRDVFTLGVVNSAQA